MTADLPPILVVDVETTGDNAECHGLVEIGAHWLTGPREGEEFEQRCVPRPSADIQAAALAVNGCDWLESADELTEAECVRSFLLWAGPHPAMLAGMNPYFDLSFLRVASRAVIGTELRMGHRTIDLHTLAVSYALKHGKPVPDKGIYSDSIMAMLGLPIEQRPHRAIAGARVEAEAFRILLGLPNLLQS